MQREDREIRQSLRGRLADRYGTVGTAEEMVVLRADGATVYGCKRILLYSPSEICLLVGKRAISLDGEGLFCASFSGGTASVRGVIRSVRYPQEKGEC